MERIYEDLIYSNFPNEVSDMERVQDVTISAKPYIDMYNNYYSNGKFTEANQVLVDHPELNKMIIGSKIFNELRDEIIATQRVFRDDIESYIFNVVKVKGNYSPTTKYIKYNVVYYNNLPYMSLSNEIPIGTLPTDIVYWYPLAIKGDKGESGLGLTPRGEWKEDTQYYQYDLVSYNNSLWIANEDNIGYFPNNSSAIWDKSLSMDFVYESMKITDDEIDAIINGTAIPTD